MSGTGLRRALSQAGLVAALWAVLTACATAAGVSALLVTAGNDRALAAAVAAADGNAESAGPDITTVVVSSATDDGASQVTADVAIPVARTALLDAAGSTDAGSDTATVSVWASSPMLYLPGEEVRRGYLLDADTVAAHAILDQGAWPLDAGSSGTGLASAIEVAVPTTTADALGIEVGSHLRLTVERQHGDEVPAGYDLVVVGVFDPTSSGAWNRDVLRGAGYAENYDWLPAYGPFVVAPGTLEAKAAPFSRISLVLDPDLAGNAGNIEPLVKRIAAVPGLIEGELGSAIGPVVMRSGLAAAHSSMRSELSLTHSLVIAVFLMVLALGLATAALVARVLAGRRATELTLLRDRGASVWQLTRVASMEVAVLAALAMVVAAPLALLAYTAIAGSDRWAASWAQVSVASAGLGPEVILAVILGATLPAVMVVLTLVPARARRARQLVSGPIARSGIDVMLGVVAVVMWLQLRSHDVSPGTIDPMLVVAPAVCVVAFAALAARAIPLLARVANAAAPRGRGVVLPLAGWNVARGGATHGTFLVVLAAAVATLGVTFLGTWSASQGDQAEAIVGADMVVAQAGSPGFAAALTAATGGVVSPVANDKVVLGTRPDGVTAVAIDAAMADEVIRGRLPGSATWAGHMQGLAPEAQGAPLEFTGDALSVTVTGGEGSNAGSGGSASASASAEPPIVTATPTFIVADEWGLVTTVEGTAVPLDGEPHAMTLPTRGQPGLAEGDWRILAIDVALGARGGEGSFGAGAGTAQAQLEIEVAGATVGEASSSDSEWGATVPASDGTVTPGAVSVASGAVEASFTYFAAGLSWRDVRLVLTSFPASTEVPVAMTGELARQLGLVEGDRIAMTWGSTRVDAVLAGTVEYVPSHVREDAILVDLPALQRGLVSAGYAGPVSTEWWISAPDAGAADAATAQGWGPVVSASEYANSLRDGPLRVSLKFAWAFAVAAAVSLAIAGSAAHAAGAALERASSIAKLRAVGVPRRAALASHLVQQAMVAFTSVAVGVGVGVALAWLIAPLLVGAPGGQQAVPGVVMVWSVVVTAAAAAAIAVGAFAVGIPAALAVVKRSTVAALRAGDAS